MSTGLLIKDENGRVVIAPDTFTVRLIARVLLPVGVYAAPVRLSCPKARLGMFVVCSPLRNIPIPGLIGYNDDYTSATKATWTRFPTARVEDGAVVCAPSGSNTVFDGNIDLMVMANV